MMAPFLRRHLASSPFVDVALVEEAIVSFRQFHLWPKPLCDIVLDMLRCLSMETRSPGVTWRRQIERGFPALTGQPSNGFELSSFVFTAPESVLANVLESTTVRVPSEREVTAAAVIAIFQSVGVGGGESAENGDESGAGLVVEEPKLQYLSLKKLRGVYGKIRECLEQSIQMSSAADAMAFVLARLDHLHKAALRHVAREEARCKEKAPFPPNPPISVVLCGLPVRFAVSRVSFDCALAGREPGSKWPRRNAMKPLRELVAEMVFSLCFCCSCFVEVFEKTRAHAPGRKRIVARILIEGGDYELHHMLGAFVALVQSDVELSSKIKFRFFLLPSYAAPRRVCAAFLCSVDPWFAKTVGVGLRGPIACASSLSTATADAATNEETISETSFYKPPLVLQAMLNDYLLAKHTNHLLVMFFVFSAFCKIFCHPNVA